MTIKLAILLSGLLCWSCLGQPLSSIMPPTNGGPDVPSTNLIVVAWNYIPDTNLSYWVYWWPHYGPTNAVSCGRSYACGLWLTNGWPISFWAQSQSGSSFSPRSITFLVTNHPAPPQGTTLQIGFWCDAPFQPAGYFERLAGVTVMATTNLSDTNSWQFITLPFKRLDKVWR